MADFAVEVSKPRLGFSDAVACREYAKGQLSVAWMKPEQIVPELPELELGTVGSVSARIITGQLGQSLPMSANMIAKTPRLAVSAAFADSRDRSLAREFSELHDFAVVHRDGPPSPIPPRLWLQSALVADAEPSVPRVVDIDPLILTPPKTVGQSRPVSLEFLRPRAPLDVQVVRVFENITSAAELKQSGASSFE
jgi:hypothetical protein